ncbi:related to RKM5-protein lysine methyltransferase [Sporisorium reilianum f. sp. reilianum]|uniref:Related to RKM5-protein lysine methyltransferase n=1 Tax=Sporisorium reilianum f. sp. reilianum TaxID=72559 RepID=A0A2N8UHL2_9BASI|nr:related to RKM5-protein lysine methyltransferase [Sporisorium reilianum f. sp. reilianum]
MPATDGSLHHPKAHRNDDHVDDGDEELPAPPTPILRLAPARLVDDVDEEIFLLYTLNAKSEHDGGLGYVNHSRDKIHIAIDGSTWTSAPSDRNLTGQLVVPIYQHVTSLRSSKGDTGSVVWRSTVELAIRFHRDVLFDLSHLKNATMLELGAGTGALPAMLASLAKTWLATDQEQLLPLMRKNLDSCSNVQTAPLDWFDFLRPPSSHSAQLRKSHILDHFAPATAPDLIICCDCIYNPGLFDALIATLNVFTQPQHTIVLVSCEMRSDQSLADFLTKWKESDPAWRILSLEDRFEKGFVALAAWKV